jgi:hypothetical protein
MNWLFVGFLKFIAWLFMVFLAESAWLEMNKTIFSSFAWVAIFLPLLLLFLFSSRIGEPKILRWLFILVFGFGSLYCFAFSAILIGLLCLFIAMQLSWVDIKGRGESSIDKSNGTNWFNEFVSLVLAFFTLWGGLNISGYCFAKHSYLSDKEKIHIAVAYAFKRGFKGIHDYQDVEDFLANNPDCCSVSSNCPSGTEDGIDRALGKISSCVYVLEANSDVRSEDKVTSAIAISNCGKVWSFF